MHVIKRSEMAERGVIVDSLSEQSVVYRLAEPSQRHEHEFERTYVLPAKLEQAGVLGAAGLPRLELLHASNGKGQGQRR